MADLVVEVHVPLTPTPGLPAGDYGLPWIDDVEDFMGSLEGSTDGEEYDSGEELGGEYLFFLAGASESQLIALAQQIADLPRMPAGVYATINDSEGDMGDGRRVDLKS